MTVRPWALEGIGFGTCTCDYGCPCQFNAPPTGPGGSCAGIEFSQIDRGHYGAVALDGLRFVWLGQWPGAIHEGDGALQLIIDENANTAQREALRRIIYSEDSDEPLTLYAIFRSTCTIVHEPIVAPIEMEVDIEARTGRGVVPGVVNSVVEPIRNPVTGAPHRAQTVLPEGFAATLIENASGTSRSIGPISLEFAGRFAGISRMHMTDRGIVRD